MLSHRPTAQAPETAIRRRTPKEPQTQARGRLRARPPRVTVVADDVTLRRLNAALAHEGLGQQGRAATAGELLASSSARDADAIVLSWSSDGDPRATIRDLRERLDARIVVVAPARTTADLREWLAAGCDAVVLDTDVEAALGATIRAACAGQLVLPESAREQSAARSLSTREKQVLALVVMGCGNGEIARRLHITEATVKSHLSAAFRKLGVRSRSDAAAKILDPGSGLGFGILAISDAAAPAEAR